MRIRHLLAIVVALLVSEAVRSVQSIPSIVSREERETEKGDEIAATTTSIPPPPMPSIGKHIEEHLIGVRKALIEQAAQPFVDRMKCSDSGKDDGTKEVSEICLIAERKRLCGTPTPTAPFGGVEPHNLRTIDLTRQALGYNNWLVLREKFWTLWSLFPPAQRPHLEPLRLLEEGLIEYWSEFIVHHGVNPDHAWPAWSWTCTIMANETTAVRKQAAAVPFSPALYMPFIAPLQLGYLHVYPLLIQGHMDWAKNIQAKLVRFQTRSNELLDQLKRNLHQRAPHQPTEPDPMDASAMPFDAAGRFTPHP